ncbi:hypothetical protein GCM10011506_00050 [Marivirga lumbricoides]|uniref:Disease resistance R13L4/SHOC-2-like LRR domain-containing protein n=2 Tax=Marivirga lumbricoides TaxID=1046115 RepID=A0ABQ1L7E3_9BACT|nr:hypothetical protein GCM10011506_00050 [Marivirga lumbricoides]
MVLTNGNSIEMQNGKAVIVLTDSSYIDTKISRDSAISELRRIPKFSFSTHSPTKSFTKHDGLRNSTRKDTITHLTFADLKKLPLFQILKCKNLKEIELIGSSTKKLPWLLNWKLFGLDSLRKITIYNYACKKPFRFSKNRNIKELVYRDSPYASAPKSFHKLKNLKKIDFVRNDFRPTEKFNLHRLAKLESANLSNNSVLIKNLANDTVQNLTQLILSFNQLKAVPKEIGYFPELIELQLAENEIVSQNIDPAIGTLRKLVMLSFYKNNLTEVPDYFFNSPHLTEFDIYYNNVEKLPETLTSAQKLERLFLANNRIFQLPENMGNLNNLKELYLHHNRISYLPESMKKLANITDFHVNNNYLNAFPSCALSFNKLEDLDISFNEIHSIPEAITSLNHLKYLWIRGITFEAESKSKAESIIQTLEQLQKQGVKVSIELDQENL